MDRQGGQRETIELAPLTDAETVVLLSRLFASEDAPPLRELEHLAKEAEGLPFFAHELARYLSHTVSAENAPSHLQLGNMLRRRVEGLPDDDRRLLEIVSIAGGPIEHEVAGLAARATGGIKRTLTVLERSSFIRSTSIGSDRRAEIYHHKLRETVIAGLAPETRRSHHCAIADAILTTATPNLSRVVDHYDAAGERDAVRRYVVPAAKQAASLFAFERAAGLYRRAVEVGSPDLRPWELYARLGDALSECGRGREAGEAFERAADLLPVASERDHGVFLRRRSAEQYLQSGQWTRAPRALDRVLEPLGIEMPQSTAEATYRIVVNRVRAEFRLRFSSLATTNAPIAVADRAELLRTLTQVYSFSDYLTGMAFASQLLADALEVGDPRQIMLGLALESVIWASTPGGLAKKQADRLLSRFTELLSHAGPFERAGYHNCKGMISWYAGDFLEAVRCLDLSPAEFRTARRDVAFYLAVTQSFRFPALAHLGRISLLSSELEVQLLDAEARGDNYFLAVAAQGHQTLAWLAADRPDRALYWRDRVLSILPAGFTVSHQMCTVSKTLVHLYRGDGHEALAAVESAWPNLRKLQFLRMPYFGEDLRQLRARALLSAASAAARRGRPEEHLVRRALEVADEIALDPAPHAVGHAALIRAGAAVLRGEHRRAQHLLADALDCFDLTNLRLYAETTRLALGNLSSEGGDVRRTRALEWMKSEGISNPRALAETMAPGCFIP
jgi:tetratricopeptide (TPR) repeat protein